MRKLPTDLSGQQVVRALAKAGFFVSRQRGSHIILYRSDPKARVVVPDHRVVRPGTLRQILAEADLSVEAFLDLLA